MKQRQKKINKFCLIRPDNSEMSKKYTEYVRSQVQLISPAGAIFMGIIALVALIPAIKKQEFADLSDTIKPNTVIFLLSAALTLSILLCYLIARKHPIASEFVAPMFILCFLLFCIPTFYENPKEAKLIKT